MKDHRSAGKDLHGTGVVYIAWDQENRWYHGYWERSPMGPPSVLEQMPDTPSIEEALAWGRVRSPIVLIRPAFDATETYWAGAEPSPERFRNLPVLPSHI